MNKRHIVALLPADVLRERIPLAALSGLEGYIAAAIDDVYNATFHRLQKHDYRFHSRTGSSTNLSEIIEAFYPSGEHRPLRIVISPREVSFDFDPGPGHKNLIFSIISKTVSWQASDRPYVRGKIETPPHLIPCLAFDILFDISFANSEAILPVIERFLAGNDINALYRRKVDFINRKGLLTSPIYGAIDPRVGYASFTAAARLHNGLKDVGHLVRSADLWDDFINEDLASFRASSDQLFSDLRAVVNYGGQFSTKLFQGRNLQPGSIIVFRPISRPRRSTRLLQSFSKTFGLRNWLPANPFVISMKELRSNNSLRVAAEEAVRAGYARAFRLYFGG
jgi:hypothetical protein